MSTLESLAVGQKVMVYDTPDGRAEGTIVVIQDTIGKKIGVRLDQHHPVGHTLDGLVPGGYGWWTLPENIAVL